MTSEEIASIYSHYRYLLQGIADYLQDGDEAEDVYQDAILKLLLLNKRGEAGPNAKGLFYMTVGNKAVDARRRIDRRPGPLPEILVHDRIDRSQLIADAVDAALASDLLDWRQRRAFGFCRIMGLSASEAARRSGLTSKVVRRSLEKADAELRRIFRGLGWKFNQL